MSPLEFVEQVSQLKTQGELTKNTSNETALYVNADMMDQIIQDARRIMEEQA